MIVALWITLAFFAGLAVKPLGLPPLVGYVFAGFGLAAMGYGHDNEALLELAHIGVLLLLFSVGLKLNIRSLIRPEIWITACVHLMLLIGIATAVLISGMSMTPFTALVLAIALSFSSTVIAAKSLEEKRELRNFHGRVAIGILVIQDIFAVIILSIAVNGIPSLWGIVLLALPFAMPLLFKLLDLSGEQGELVTLAALFTAVVAGGFLFESLGLSPELGALVLGALIAQHPNVKELSHTINPIKNIFLVCFFLSIGLYGLPSMHNILLALGFSLLLPIKALLFFFLLLQFRLRARSSFLAALSLSSFSEFGLVLANEALDLGWLTPDMMTTLVLAVAFSFVMAAVMDRLGRRLFERYEVSLGHFETKKRHLDDEPIHVGNASILIFGMGRIGTGVYDYFREKNLNPRGFDSDKDNVASHQAAKRKVRYADADDDELWEHLYLDSVEVIILALNSIEPILTATHQLRKRGYKGIICANTAYEKDSEALMAAGVNITFNHYAHSGENFAKHILTVLPEI